MPATERPATTRAAMTRLEAAAHEGGELFSRLDPVGPRESVGGLLARHYARLPDHAAFAERRGDGFQQVTWRELAWKAAGLARFLSEVGVRGGDRIVVVSANRGEMLVTEFASLALGATYVPIFAGYAAQQATALVAQARPHVLVVSGQEMLKRTGVPATARAVLTFDPVDDVAMAGALGSSHAAHRSLPDAIRQAAVDEEAVQRFLDAAAAVDPATVAIMMYTSGTSGRLKGVMLTHDNILSQQRALAAIWSVTTADRFLSYLPWHHSFGGLFEKYTALYHGATLHLDDSLGKDIDRLLTNWFTVRPTIYFSVPKIYQQLVTRAESRPEEETRIIHSELRFVFTAAASLPAHLAAFFSAHSIPVLEGWGLTETSPCCTITDLAEPRTVPGRVGYPIPGVRLRLGRDGEILVRGPNVMQGYFEDPYATKTALPVDGWFRTGDLGAFEERGLRLVTRRDRVFKLANAEKVIPTAIEQRLTGMNSYILHVIVVGSGRDQPAAVVFPDLFRITEEFGDDRVAADHVVKESIRETLLEFNRTHPVKYERIQAVAMISRELTIEHDELTPSLKVRVGNVLEDAREYVEAMYSPSPECDCRILRKIMRVVPDDRRCFAGLDRTIDSCHACGSFVFDEIEGDHLSDTRGVSR